MQSFHATVLMSDGDLRSRRLDKGQTDKLSELCHLTFYLTPCSYVIYCVAPRCVCTLHWTFCVFEKYSAHNQHYILKHPADRGVDRQQRTIVISEGNSVSHAHC